MANYEEAKVKLTNAHFSKLKSASKNKTGTTEKLRKNVKMKNYRENYFKQQDKKPK